MTSRRAVPAGRVIFASLLVCAAAGPAVGQTSLGGQRVGTSSGDFLKIGVGAKAVAMGGAFVAIADDPSALYWNPAGIAGMETRGALFSHTSWFTDVNAEFAALVVPVPQLASGVVGIQVATLSTELDETTEFSPEGTGRSFTYSDLVVGLGYSRYFTDKFAIGANLKYFREDMGSAVGGGLVSTLLADLGTMYHIGFRDMNFAVTITNFGPELQPSGEYQATERVGDVLTASDAEFLGFAPPTTFKMALSGLVMQSDDLRSVASVEMNRPGDNAETLKMGGEVFVKSILALRAGYDWNADELNLSAGGGVRFARRGNAVSLDYAFTDSDNFGRVDRFALAAEF